MRQDVLSQSPNVCRLIRPVCWRVCRGQMFASPNTEIYLAWVVSIDASMVHLSCLP